MCEPNSGEDVVITLLELIFFSLTDVAKLRFAFVFYM